MIKIILKNGTVIEMDKYERALIEDIKGLAHTSTASLESNGHVCKICKTPLFGSHRVKCSKESCKKAIHVLQCRKWYNKNRKGKRVPVAPISVPVSVPVSLIS